MAGESNIHFFIIGVPFLILQMSPSSICLGMAVPIVLNLQRCWLKRKSLISPWLEGIHISDNLQAKEYYQNAHHLIVHTEVQKKQLLQNTLFKTLNIQVMPLGIDTSSFYAQRKKHRIRIELLFVGRISRLKQIELCIETLAFLIENQKKTVSLTIVGPISDEAYFSELNIIGKTIRSKR